MKSCVLTLEQGFKMKYRKIKTVFFAAILVLAAGPAFAQGIGVINMQAIMQTSDAAKSINKQMQTQEKKYRTEISKHEEDIRSSEAELRKQQDLLGAEEFEGKRKSFEKDVIEAQKLVQQRKRTLDIGYGKAMQKLAQEAEKIARDIAKEKGIALVLPSDSVFIAEKSLDITQPVLEKLNKSLKTIPVQWEQN